MYDATDKLGISSPTRSIDQQVLHQGNSMQMLTVPQTLTTSTKTRPLSNLHDIVSHQIPKIIISGEMEVEGEKKVEDRVEEANLMLERKVRHEADLSPQSSTNSNTSRTKGESKPSRVNPKRSGKATFK
ncbi:hypothetical protein KY290_021327 [Solanum tuberosum]|uniref:Uncharacterized protein n=1 Tax=Solanum tuberosum TaxID=4113 RepID=A0ABQ7V188_SOLTU|nr:hypothetical protein KY290_021327 [Solanum tuberosum]